MTEDQDQDFARLHPDDIDAIARRLSELLSPPVTTPKTHLRAKDVAQRYGLKDVGWVYDHKHELGAVPLGQGKKPRWLFPVEACDAYFLKQAELREAKNAPRPRRQGARPRKPKGTNGDPRIAAPKPLVSVYG